jgi:hypothetical protein
MSYWLDHSGPVVPKWFTVSCIVLLAMIGVMHYAPPLQETKPTLTKHESHMSMKIRGAKTGDILVSNRGKILRLEISERDIMAGGGVRYRDTHGRSYSADIDDLARETYDIVSPNDASTYTTLASCAFKDKSVMIDGPSSALFTCGD